MKFKGYDFLKQWEGLELEAYKDVGGVWSIGYGHTKDVKPGDVITVERAKRLLDEDLLIYEKAVNDSVHVPLNQNQYDALVSLCYNIGVTGFKNSTVVKRINTGDYIGAAEAILWWNKVNGVVVRGLKNRRAAERTLFFQEPLSVPTVEEQIEALLREYTEKLKGILNV